MPAPSTDDILQLRVDLATYWREFHRRADQLIDAYHGNYQKMWPNEFRRGEVAKIANWIKLGWDRFATMVGKAPSNHVPPSRLRRLSQSRADKIEKVLSHYDYSSGMKRLSRRYAWWLCGVGAGAIGVVPDPIMKGPRYVVKDPRVVLPSPGAGSSPLTSGSYGFLSKPDMTAASLYQLVLNETVTGDYLRSQYGEEVNRHLEGHNINTPQEVITYMDKNWWVLIVNGKRFMEVETGLGYVPFRFTTMEVPDQLGGQSQFEQNIGLVLAYIKTLNQKLTYNKNLTWPWLVIKGLNDIDHDSRVIEILERDGDAAFLNPPAELQAERDLEMLDRLIRVMNHDTETMQGEAPGSVVTGSGARELNRDVRNLVMDYWEIQGPDYEFVKSAALSMDEGLYAEETKPMYGKTKGEEFEEEYQPSKIIKGNTHVVVDFGIGVGGMEGFVELMQTAAQGYADEQTVMEGLPWIKSVSDTRRRVLLDKIEKTLLEMVAGQAPAPLINHLVSWRKAIEDEEDPYEWLDQNPMPNPEMPGLGGEGVPPEGLKAPPDGNALALPEGGTPALPRTPSPQQLMALVQGRGGR